MSSEWGVGSGEWGVVGWARSGGDVGHGAEREFASRAPVWTGRGVPVTLIA